MHGVYVIEKIITSFEKNLIFDFFNIIMDNFILLSLNANGITVIKKFIIICNHIPDFRIKIFEIISFNFVNFIQHPFANYSIQLIIEVIYLLFILELVLSFNSSLFKTFL